MKRARVVVITDVFHLILIMIIDDPRVDENIAELARALSRINDNALIDDFFRSLLTPAEVADIASRWALVKALQEKVPQREIAKDLGVSLCKITRGSRELKKENSAFARVIDISAKIKN